MIAAALAGRKKIGHVPTKKKGRGVKIKAKPG